MTRVQIVATAVTFEQENLISPIKMSFRTIQRATVEKGILLSSNFFRMPMVLWRDYLIGPYFRQQPCSGGLFLWSMTENTIFYFEVCHSFFPSSGALNPNSRQMESRPHCAKAVDDVLFVALSISGGIRQSSSFRCIYIPSLVISTQLPGGSLSLTENAFDELPPKCIMESPTAASFSLVYTKIYPIPACPPTYPRYCFISKRFLRYPWRVEWDVFEVQVDLSIPGPIKIFSRVSLQYTVQHPASPLHDSDNDLLLYLRLGRNGQPRAPPSVRFLRVGKPDKWRMARLGGVDKMRLARLSVDRDAGFAIIWAAEDWPQATPEYGFICWLDERKASDTVYSRTRELISSWSRRLMRCS